jgi:very-short-patch-repair endonuclease
MTLHEFIKKANELHNTNNITYNYDKIKKIEGCRIPVIIYCIKCADDFFQCPEDHLRGCGCQKCGIEKSRFAKFDTTNTFIDKANNLCLYNKFSYTNIEYINCRTPIEVTCLKCQNIIRTTPNNFLRGRGCPKCKQKTELKLLEFLKTKYPTIWHQYKVDWCKKKRHLPFDFSIEEYKIIIELDGRQHFEQVSKWDSPDYIRRIDKYKMYCANQNGFSVIRILQEDVWGDNYNWKDDLEDTIEKILCSSGTSNIYLCNNNEYDILQKMEDVVSIDDIQEDVLSVEDDYIEYDYINTIE